MSYDVVIRDVRGVVEHGRDLIPAQEHISLLANDNAKGAKPNTRLSAINHGQ